MARYGGEEFAIIMPGADITHALSKAEEIRQRIGSTDFDNVVAGKIIKMNLSIGIASFPEHDGDEPGTLMNNADSALYKAKNNGRNQVVAYYGPSSEY